MATDLTLVARHPGGCKEHAFQDKNYGHQYRVLNPCRPKDRDNYFKCTVCGKGPFSQSELQRLR
jgi:hypothetical protein